MSWPAALWQARLDKARRELLDLGLRNSLLNYRLRKSRGVEVVDELPAEVFRTLAEKGRHVTFLPIPDEGTETEQTSQFAQPDEPE